MKDQKNISDEIPVTSGGLEFYISSMENAIKPIAKQYNKMNDLLKEAKVRYERIKSSPR